MAKLIAKFDTVPVNPAIDPEGGYLLRLRDRPVYDESQVFEEVVKEKTLPIDKDMLEFAFLAVLKTMALKVSRDCNPRKIGNYIKFTPTLRGKAISVSGVNLQYIPGDSVEIHWTTSEGADALVEVVPTESDIAHMTFAWPDGLDELPADTELRWKFKTRGGLADADAQENEKNHQDSLRRRQRGGDQGNDRLSNRPHPRHRHRRGGVRPVRGFGGTLRPHGFTC